MLVSFPSRRALLVFTLVALPFLVGGSCTVIWSSGGGSSDNHDRDKNNEQTTVAAAGTFGNPPVAGLRYLSGALSGTTGENGEFVYEPGQSVQFFIGDIRLGPPVTAKPDMSPTDLVAGEAGEASSEVNIRRLLKSLDADPGDETVTIPGEVQAAAVMTNDEVATAIEFLDFADDAVFANTASQLVAVLTSDYPFTAMLVEAGDVQPTRSVTR